MKLTRATWNLWLTALLAVALIPALKLAHLPTRFAWNSLIVAYWWALAFQSTFFAILLYAIQFPGELFRNISRRTEALGKLPWREIASIFVPAAYLFVGLVVVCGYSDLLASMRFNVNADLQLARMDRWLLGGHSIPRVSLETKKWAELIYFAMFPQIGATIILLGLRRGIRSSMQFTAAIMSAYYLTLMIFYFAPATGPYYLDWLQNPRDPNLGLGQVLFAEILHGRNFQIIGKDYFAALPCMHVIQPLIVLWFLRHWKRIVAVLGVFDLVLVPCILVLRQHYVIDLIAGVFAAAIVIAAPMLSGQRRKVR